jgi:hypothetical protein
MNRKDWYLGRIHVIKRKYTTPQYGMLIYRPLTIDIWFNKTLWTFRKGFGGWYETR